MKSAIVIIIGVLSYFLVSCDSRSAELKEIDRIIESDPEGAFESLKGVRASELSGADYAYYCLLYTQAQIKNNVVLDSDSLIRIPYEMYGRDRNGDLKRRACFYNASVLYNRGDLRSAMRDALMAYEIAKDEDNPYWIAKSAELMGDIFYDIYNYKQAELYSLETIENYKKAGRELNHRYALCDLASAYFNENRDEEGFAILDSLNKVVANEQPLDSALSDYIKLALYSVIVEKRESDELEDSVSHYLRNREDDIDLLITNSHIVHDDQGFEASSFLLAKAYQRAKDDKERIRIMYAVYEHALSAGNYKRAALMSDSLLRLQSSIADEILTESVTGVQRDFYSTKAKYQERKSKETFYILFGVIFAIATISILLIFIFKLKIRAKKAEIENNIASLISFKEQAERVSTENRQLFMELTDKSVALESLRQKLENHSQAEIKNMAVIEHLFQEQWSTLNMLCNEYFEMGDSAATRNAILSRIEKELKKLGSKKNLKEIENAVDRYMGNIMTLLRKECDFLKEEDFVFLSLIYAGLSVRAVCLFTGIKYKLHYLKKSRLIKRISDSSAPHKSLFIEKLS